MNKYCQEYIGFKEVFWFAVIVKMLINDDRVYFNLLFYVVMASCVNLLFYVMMEILIMRFRLKPI